MSRPQKSEVELHGGPLDGKKVLVHPDTTEYRDPGTTKSRGGDTTVWNLEDPAPHGVYVKDAKGVFRWENE